MPPTLLTAQEETESTQKKKSGDHLETESCEATGRAKAFSRTATGQQSGPPPQES